MKKIVIGLTGNIACGKSFVARELARLGAEIVDADLVSREVQRSGTPAYEKVVAAFGSGILREDGEIDRARLGPVVFSDPEKLRLLERIVHPAVLAREEELIAASSSPVVVIEAIKLIESGNYLRCDQVWVVTCTPERQLERLMHERNMSYEAAMLRINAQPPQSEKLKYADVVIDNSGTPEQTYRQVAAAWQRLAAAALQTGTDEGA